jgi:NAD(P)H-hydrate repair Nnr-like enzyme with NAD(P)H-hydrate dehydratase domain
VLTGVIAAVISQYMMPSDQLLLRAKLPKMPTDPGRPLDLFDAARIGVQAHARAGERWAEQSGAEAGLLATELADLIPAALEEIRR